MCSSMPDIGISACSRRDWAFMAIPVMQQEQHRL
jgi:hypothetical protein